MNNILNAQEAFNAMISGKQVLARQPNSVGCNESFSPIEEFPTSIFVMPGIEFCIQLEMLELAGIKFTKPCAIDELEKGQEIFVCIFPCAEIHKIKFDHTTDMQNFVRCGVVQRDEENAKLQMKAYHAFLGLDLSLTINGVAGSEKKQSSKRPTKKEIEAHKDVILDAIAACITSEEVNTTCYGLDKLGFNEAQLGAIESAKMAKLQLLAEEKAAAESEAEKLFQDNTADNSEPELSVLCEAFIEDIQKSLSLEDLNAIRHRINANGVLTESEHTELAKHIDLKTASFDIPEAPAQKNYIEEEETKYQEKLADLLKRVDESNTPAEVNAVTKYTNAWSAEQRQPLLKRMHKRLEELQQEKVAKQPSLMVQIQNAPDLTALDALEIDVAALDPVAQPEMMRIVRLRRTELEQAANDSSIEEDLP